MYFSYGQHRYYNCRDQIPPTSLYRIALYLVLVYSFYSLKENLTEVLARPSRPSKVTSMSLFTVNLSPLNFDVIPDMTSCPFFR